MQRIKVVQRLDSSNCCFFLIIARSKNSIMMTKQDLPNEVLVGLLYEYKVIEIIKKNFFLAGLLVDVDSQQTTQATRPITSCICLCAVSNCR